MFLVKSLMTAIAGILIRNLVSYSECQVDCGTLARSTCTDDFTTKWNKDSIGETLAKWITNIRKIRSVSDEEKKHYFLTKTVLEFKKKSIHGKILGDGVQFISNTDCLKKKNIGPTWRKTSIFSGTQFNDGFLYGIEDDNGELTGVYSIHYYSAYNY